MSGEIKLAGQPVGPGHPVYIVAEIGINHNGDITIAKKLIDVACQSGCNAVKFQKRTPELCVPADQKSKMRETPWGYITYLEYRYKTEFDLDQYRAIDLYCKQKGITWLASCWDEPSIDFVEQFNPPCHKIPSAALTNTRLLKHFRQTGKPLVLSTGMSTMEEIRQAVEALGTNALLLTHCTSTYPCPPSELNLKMISTLSGEFPCPIGYSGHEVGLPMTVAAVALGACYVERHITLDRAMWGSDHASSVESGGLERLVRYIRVLEESMGDGIKRVYPSESALVKRLRNST